MKNKKELKIIVSILIFLALINLLLYSVLAFEFDNVKRFDDKIGKYGEIKIVNSFGLGGDVAAYRINFNTDKCFNECYTEGTAVLNDDRILFSDTKFYDTKGIEKNIKRNKIYLIKEREETKEVPLEIKECIVLKNLSLSCGYKTSNKKETYKTNYQEEYKGEILKAGTYKWRVEGTKEFKERIDFIPFVDSFKFSEWVWWDSAYTKCRNINFRFTSVPSERFNEPINVNITINNTDYAHVFLLFSGINNTNYSVYYNSITNMKIVNTSCNDETGKEQNFQVISNSSDITYRKQLFIYYENEFNKTNGDSLTTGGWSGGGTYTTSKFHSAPMSMTKNDLGGASFDYYKLLNSSFTNVYWVGMLFDNGINLNTQEYNYFLRGNGTYVIQGIRTQLANYSWGNPGTVEYERTRTGNNNSWIDFKAYFNESGMYSWTGGIIGANPLTSITHINRMDLDGYLTNTFFDDIFISIYNISVYMNKTQYNLSSEITPPSAPIINLIAPTSLQYFNYTNVLFNCTAKGSEAIINLSLIIDGTINYTVYNTTAIENLSIELNRNLPEGTHTYYCNAFSSTNKEGTAAPRTFTIDLTAPVINFWYPRGEIQVFNNTFNLTINVSVSHDALIPISCKLFNGTGNTSVTCSTNTTVWINESGYKTFIYYSNDTAGNNAFNSTTFLINYLRPSVTYSSVVVSGETNDICLNLNTDNITTLSSNLTYNNTLFEMSGTSNNTYASYCINATASTFYYNNYFNFTINYNINGFDYYTNNYTVAVYTVPELIVNTTCSPAALTFILLNEENLSVLDTGVFDYNFQYGLTNSTIRRSSGTITGSNFTVCINDTISNNWSLGNGEIFYRAGEYVDRRYYLFNSVKLSNSTQSIILNDLLNSRQTSFKLEIQDTSLTPYINKYVALIRWYPSLAQYRVVDMGLTDESGNTVIHVKTEDVDYRIGVYELNGDLIKLSQPVRMVCLVSPCTYTLSIAPQDNDFTSFLGVTYSLTFNESNNIWSFIYSDDSGKTNTMNLTVYKMTSTDDISLCSVISVGATGSLLCNTTGYTGDLKAIARRSSSPAVIIAEKIVSISSSVFKSSFGLWISILLAIPIIFIFAMMSPIVALFGGVIALIPAWYLGSINIGIIGGFAVLAAIISHFLKRIN